MTTILCATDLLPKSEAAIERAGMLAAELSGTVTMLHVVPPVDSERVLKQTLQNASGHAKSRGRAPMWRRGPEPSVLVRAGNPARLIAEAVDQVKADLLVIGPHQKRGLQDALEGTIAAKALSARKCPLLIVQGEPRMAYRNVMLALDLSPASGVAVRAAESLVLPSGAHAHVLHAYEPPYQGTLYYADVATNTAAAYAEARRRQAQNAVRDLLKYQSRDFTRYEILIAPGQPATAILDALKFFQPDLLVMGTRGRGRMQRALLGSVANQILPRVGSDVLVVPNGSFIQRERARRPSEESPSARAFTERDSES